MKEKENPLNELRKAQQTIMGSLSYLDSLNLKYKQKQQKTFMNTFLQVMDKMSNQLMQAYQHFENIDKQICTDPKCILLFKQLNYFKLQSLQLSNDLNAVSAELQAAKKKNINLKQNKQKVNAQLKNKIKYIEKHRSIKHNSNTSKDSRQKQTSFLRKSVDLGKQKISFKDRSQFQQLGCFKMEDSVNGVSQARPKSQLRTLKFSIREKSLKKKQIFEDSNLKSTERTKQNTRKNKSCLQSLLQAE